MIWNNYLQKARHFNNSHHTLKWEAVVSIINLLASGLRGKFVCWKFNDQFSQIGELVLLHPKFVLEDMITYHRLKIFNFLEFKGSCSQMHNPYEYVDWLFVDRLCQAKWHSRCQKIKVSSSKYHKMKKEKDIQPESWPKSTRFLRMHFCNLKENW